MKNGLLVSIVALLFSCSGEESATRTFIPGVYARAVQNEFSEGKDTLIIQHLGKDVYSLEHRMSYQRMTEGKAGAVERKQEHFTALWDEKSGALVEQKKGRLLTFQPETKTLLMGSSVYKRLY